MTALALYKIIFMTELIIAEGILTFRMAKRERFWLRVSAAVLFCYFAAFAFPVIEGISYSSWYTSLMFLLFFVITLFALLFVYKITWGGAVFCALTAYTMQHLAYGLFSILMNITQSLDFGGMYGDQILDFSSLNEWTAVVVLSYLNIYAFVYVVGYFILAPYFKYNQDLKLKSVSVMIFVVVILIIDIVLNAVVVYVSDETVKDYVLYVYNIFCCVLAFYMQVELINSKNMKSEIEIMAQTLKLAQNQYALRKENIDLINMKCHDLKYRISRFAHQGGLDKESVAELEKMVSIYDAAVETGNEILDVILTEKSLICSEKNIKLTCMADCTGLNFVREGDLYVLFGNVIDNAIEAVVQIGDETKRCIGLNVRTVGNFITISLNNYFQGKIKFSADGLPCTSKKDVDFHGFGMRSVAMIVEKYKGTMNIETDEGIFKLSILFPLPKNG